MSTTLDRLAKRFTEQFPDLHIGEFLNPKLVGVSNNGIAEYRCHYDNYEGDDDCWTWHYDVARRRFFN